MAEGYLRHLGADKFQVRSAGLEAHGINPIAIRVMAEDGVDIRNQQSDTVTNDLTDWPDHVITLCGHADEHCPHFPGKVVKNHWPFIDPAKACGDEQQVLECFRSVRDDIRERIKQLIADND